MGNIAQKETVTHRRKVRHKETVADKGLNTIMKPVEHIGRFTRKIKKHMFSSKRRRHSSKRRRHSSKRRRHSS